MDFQSYMTRKRRRIVKSHRFQRWGVRRNKSAMSSSNSSSGSHHDLDDEGDFDPPPLPRAPDPQERGIVRMPLEGLEPELYPPGLQSLERIDFPEISVSEATPFSATDIESDRSGHENDSSGHLSDSSGHQNEIGSDSGRNDNETEVSENSDLDEQESLMDLAREWILTQLGRNCSNAVADDFFQLAWSKAHLFVRLREENNGRENLLPDLRRKVIREKLPPIKMDFLMKGIEESEKAGEEVLKHEFNHLHFPRRKFPQDKFELLSQVTRVKVRKT